MCTCAHDKSRCVPHPYLVVCWADGMLTMLCSCFGMESAALTLLTGQAIHVCHANGDLAPGICPDRWGFCGWSFLSPHHEVMVVEDLAEDARWGHEFNSLRHYILPKVFFFPLHVLGGMPVDYLARITGWAHAFHPFFIRFIYKAR